MLLYGTIQPGAESRESEYARVKRLYDKLKIPERTEFEYFNGHTINGVGTFQFLHRHLKWPEPNR